MNATAQRVVLRSLQWVASFNIFFILFSPVHTVFFLSDLTNDYPVCVPPLVVLVFGVVIIK